MQSYNKSPLNYIGGKYKILPQILEYFPQDINNFIDLFAGGLDVAANVKSKKTFCNDINFYTIQIYEAMQEKSIDEILDYIDDRIEEFHLSKTNEEGYIKFRSHYNSTKNPLDLYVLVCYSFNYQFRFNGRHEYNNPFGKNRSSFNSTIRDNLVKFHANIKDFVFSCENFKDYNISFLGKSDFLYADPPYRITVGSYNDGKRGFEGWSKEDDIILFNRLDDLNSRGVKFALSNVSEHRGQTNDELVLWAKKYNVNHIEKNYNNSSYQVKDKNSVTTEILVVNY